MPCFGRKPQGGDDCPRHDSPHRPALPATDEGGNCGRIVPVSLCPMAMRFADVTCRAASVSRTTFPASATESFSLNLARRAVEELRARGIRPVLKLSPRDSAAHAPPQSTPKSFSPRYRGTFPAGFGHRTPITGSSPPRAWRCCKSQSFSITGWALCQVRRGIEIVDDHLLICCLCDRSYALHRAPKEESCRR